MLENLSEMRAFRAVADAGTFTAAAAELCVNQSLVSRAVARLEQRLGTTLLHRSTRRVSLTDEGVVFLEGCRRLLDDADEVERSVSAKALSGTLRVSAPVLFGQDPLVPLLPEFMACHPGVELVLALEDRHVDLIEDKIDVAIRLGSLVNSSLIAKKIGEQRRLIVASPAYLAQHGHPSSADDLAKHNCLLWDEAHDEMNRWPFEVNGTKRLVKVRGRLRANNALAQFHLATLGFGITRMMEHHVHAAIRRGELVSLLQASHRDEATAVHAVCTRTNIAKPRVRALLEFLAGKMSLAPHEDLRKPPATRQQVGRAGKTAAGSARAAR